MNLRHPENPEYRNRVYLSARIHSSCTLTSWVSSWFCVRIDHPPWTLSCTFVLDTHKAAVERQVMTNGILKHKFEVEKNTHKNYGKFFKKTASTIIKLWRKLIDQKKSSLQKCVDFIADASSFNNVKNVVFHIDANFQNPNKKSQK